MYSKAHKKSKSCLMRVITTTQRRFSATFCRIYLLRKVSVQSNSQLFEKWPLSLILPLRFFVFAHSNRITP